MPENGHRLGSSSTPRKDCCVVIEYILQDTPSSEVSKDGLDTPVGVQEVKRLVT